MQQFVSILGTLAGVLLGFLLGVWNEGRLSRKSFRKEMGEIIDRFERDGCKDPVAFHEDNRLPIRAVCLKVIDDLSRQKRIELRRLRDEFWGLSQVDLIKNNIGINLTIGTHTPDGKETKRPPWFEFPGRERIWKLLTDMRDCA